MELIPRRRLRVAALVAALGLLATLLPLRPAPTSYEWTLTHMRVLSDPRVVASGTLPGDARAVTHTFSLGLLQVGTYKLELVAHAGSWASEPLLGELYVIEGPIMTRCDWL